MKKEYRFISYELWLSDYKDQYPFARRSPDGTEVVLSVNDDSGELTQQETLDYIDQFWIYEDEDYYA